MYQYRINVKYECESAPHTTTNHPLLITGNVPDEINRRVTPVNGVISLELERSSSITVKMYRTKHEEGMEMTSFTMNGIEDTWVEADALIYHFRKMPYAITSCFKNEINAQVVDATYYDEDVDVLITFPGGLNLVDETVPFNEVGSYDVSDYFTTCAITINHPVEGMRVGASYTSWPSSGTVIVNTTNPTTVNIPILKTEHRSSSPIYFWGPGARKYTGTYVEKAVEYTGQATITEDFDFSYVPEEGYFDFRVYVLDEETDEPIKDAYLEMKHSTGGDYTKLKTNEDGYSDLWRANAGDKFRLYGGTNYDWIEIQETGEYTYRVNPDELEKPKKEIGDNTDDGTTPTGDNTSNATIPNGTVTLPEYKESVKTYNDFPFEFVIVSAKKIARSLAGFKSFNRSIKYHEIEDNPFFSITPIYVQKATTPITNNTFTTIDVLKQACERTHDMKARVPVTSAQIKSIGQRLNETKDSIVLEIASDNMNDRLTPEFKKGLDELRQQKNTDSAQAALRWLMMADKFSQTLKHNFSDYPDTTNDGSVPEVFNDANTLNTFIEKILFTTETGWQKVLKIQYWLFNYNFLSPGIYSLRNEFGIDYKIAGFLSEHFFNWQAVKTQIPIEQCDFFIDQDTNMFVTTNKLLRNKADSAYQKVMQYIDKNKYNTVISYTDYQTLGENKTLELLYNISRYFASAFGYNTVCKANSQDVQTMLSEAAKIKNERLSNL